MILFQFNEHNKKKKIMNTAGSVLFGFSERKDGNMSLHGSNAKESAIDNRNRFLEKFSLGSSGLVMVKQVHGDNISIVGQKGVSPNGTPPRLLQEGDALLTSRAGIILGILTADCLPIILLNKSPSPIPLRVSVNGIGIVHAGRIGSSLRITGKTVRRFIDIFKVSPENLLCIIGPGIGRCCYEVDEKELLPFRSQFNDITSIAEPAGRGKWRLDLKAVNENQLLKAGLPKKNVRRFDQCTACASEYFSYRRDRTSDRMLSIVTIKSPHLL